MMKGPIGVFDSGYGGLTILKEMVKTLPEFDYLYLGDNARAPYGNKDFDTVYSYTLECVKWFFGKGCPLVILACNTASAKALRTIQQNDLPLIEPAKRVLGVIRPTSEVIGDYSQSGHVGVLGTVGTVQSESYLIEIGKFFPHMKVSQEACPEWVGLVEENKFDSPDAEPIIQRHISNIFEKDPETDTLLLACTHYPLLMDKIRLFTPEGVKIISQGEIIAASLSDYLKRHPEIDEKCLKNGRKTFYTTGDTEDFNSHASLFFAAEIQAQKLIIG